MREFRAEKSRRKIAADEERRKLLALVKTFANGSCVLIRIAILKSDLSKMRIIRSTGRSFIARYDGNYNHFGS